MTQHSHPVTNPAIEAILNKDAPKKLLALDGGGIRGMISVEVLSEIEAKLRKRENKPDLVLADYFDYIAGTSTGAIIAACLALGMSVDTIRRFYVEKGEEMFDRAFLIERFKYRFNDGKLAAMLQQEVGVETTLGSDKLKTLLMMVLRNASTDSPWPVSNNPFALYNDLKRKNCNLHLPLWQLIRASTAAPVYFPPEVVRIGDQEFVFVDGGVTPYNNPAFQLFLMATSDVYKLEWPAGEEKMLLVSIGTGAAPDQNNHLNPDDMHLMYNASRIPSALMYASMNEQDFLCRTFGRCRFGESLDREAGKMRNSRGPLDEKLFTYVRYNAELSKSGLKRLGLENIDVDLVQKMDSVKAIPQLRRIGKAVGKKQFSIDHFAGF